MATNLRVTQSAVPNPAIDGSFAGGIASRLGIQVTLDFYTYMSMLGQAYQVKAGTISTPLVGKVPITDTAAEMCADCVAGTTIIPVFSNLTYRLATGTLFESAAKSVATVSSAGTAFVPLPLKSNGAAATSTARVQATGSVTVTAELATTTPRHWAWSQPIAAGAYFTTYDWTPRVPPVLVGPRCFYVQVGAATTAPSYYGHFDYIEAPTATLL